MVKTTTVSAFVRRLLSAGSTISYEVHSATPHRRLACELFPWAPGPVGIGCGLSISGAKIPRQTTRLLRLGAVSSAEVCCGF